MIDLPLQVSPECSALLDSMAMDIGGTKTDVIRRALALFRLALDGIKQGKRAGLVTGEMELDTEFIGFYGEAEGSVHTVLDQAARDTAAVAGRERAGEATGQDTLDFRMGDH